MLPATKATLAPDRGAGSFGPSLHLSKLPVPTVVDTYVSSTALWPSDPPMYSRVVPSWMTDPPVRAAGRRNSSGDGCHGMTEPVGGGQGSVSLVGGHRLIGAQTSTPRSTVRPTVK